jgi:hypothetical chaperone protein
MSVPIAYAIDFGTSNSSIAVAYPDHVAIVDVRRRTEPRILLPSIIYLHRNGDRQAGDEAVQQYLVTATRRTQCGGCSLVHWQGGRAHTDCHDHRSGGACLDARLIFASKEYLADPAFKSTHSWAKDFTLPDLVAVVMRRLKRAADLESGSDIKDVVVGYPIKFAGSQGLGSPSRHALGLERLRSAAQTAGFANVELLEEPVAAALDGKLNAGTILSLDFGGGTFDVAILSTRNGRREVKARQGVAIGGDRFDAMLFDTKVAPALGLTAFQVPKAITAELRTLAGAHLLLRSRQMLQDIHELKGKPGCEGLATVEAILLGGYAYAFYRAIEKAKIDLSTRESTAIILEREHLDLRIQVTREEFEWGIQDDLAAVQSCIRSALQEAEVTPDQIDVVIRSGGSSQIPAFARLVDELFGSHKVQARPAFSSVVHGLAVRAAEIWGERRPATTRAPAVATSTAAPMRLRQGGEHLSQPRGSPRVAAPPAVPKKVERPSKQPVSPVAPSGWRKALRRLRSLLPGRRRS